MVLIYNDILKTNITKLPQSAMLHSWEFDPLCNKIQIKQNVAYTHLTLYHSFTPWKHHNKGSNSQKLQCRGNRQHGLMFRDNVHKTYFRPLNTSSDAQPLCTDTAACHYEHVVSVYNSVDSDSNPQHLLLHIISYSAFKEVRFRS